MNANTLAGAALVTSALLGATVPSVAAAEEPTIERGRYLITVAGCNDCHTPGYLENEGRVEESRWLTGSAVGFQGPWGTTYPSNLRLLLSSMSEEQWLKRARVQSRPPMPWFNLKSMTNDDLRAVYRYVRSLGPKGDPAPLAARPGAKVKTPYFVFVPQNLPKSTRVGRR